VGANAFQEIEEESTKLVLMCKCCEDTKVIPVEYTNAKEDGVNSLLLPETIVRWLRTELCPSCYENNTPATIKFLAKFGDTIAVEIEKDDMPYFRLLFPRRHSKHFRQLLNIDEFIVVRNSNIRWKDISK